MVNRLCLAPAALSRLMCKMRMNTCATPWNRLKSIREPKCAPIGSGLHLERVELFVGEVERDYRLASQECQLHGSNPALRH